MTINGSKNLSGNTAAPQKQINNLNPEQTGKILKVSSVETLGGNASAVTVQSNPSLAPVSPQTETAEQVTVSSSQTLNPITDNSTVGVKRVTVESTDNLNPARDSGNINTDAFATKTELATEASERETADTILQNNIDAATVGVSQLNTALTAETNARVAADTVLTQSIDTETAARESADTTLQNNINTETSARETADTVLQTNITSEATARASADTTLQTNIDTLAETVADTYIPLTQKAAANGVATLGASGTIPLSQIPFTALAYLGSWNASTNTPTIADGTGTTGNFYIVSTAGTWNSITFAAGDWVLYNGTTWQKVVNSNSVASVNGYTGAVVLTGGDIAVSSSDSTLISAALAAKAAVTALSDGSVTKLGTASVGSADKPIYWNAGVPTVCTTLSLNTTGSAAALTTARNITIDSFANYEGKTFDGSSDVTIAGVKIYPELINTFTSIQQYGNCQGMIYATDGPEGEYWYRFIQISYKDYSSNIWQTQIAFSPSGVYFRTQAGGAAGNFGAWITLISSNNISTQSVAAATTASNLSAASGVVILPNLSSDPSSSVVGQEWYNTSV